MWASWLQPVHRAEQRQSEKRRRQKPRQGKVPFSQTLPSGWAGMWTDAAGERSAGLGAADLSRSCLSYCSLAWVLFSQGSFAHLPKRSSNQLFTTPCSTVALLPSGIRGVLLSRLWNVPLCQCQFSSQPPSMWLCVRLSKPTYLNQCFTVFALSKDTRILKNIKHTALEKCSYHFAWTAGTVAALLSREPHIDVIMNTVW